MRLMAYQLPNCSQIASRKSQKKGYMLVYPAQWVAEGAAVCAFGIWAWDAARTLHTNDLPAAPSSSPPAACLRPGILASDVCVRVYAFAAVVFSMSLHCFQHLAGDQHSSQTDSLAFKEFSRINSPCLFAFNAACSPFRIAMSLGWWKTVEGECLLI